MLPNLCTFQTITILKRDRITLYIFIKVVARSEAYWVFADESSDVRVIVPGAVVVNSGLGVKLAARIVERIAHRTSGARDVAEGIVRVGIDQGARGVAQGRNRSKSILIVKAGGS